MTRRFPRETSGLPEPGAKGRLYSGTAVVYVGPGDRLYASPADPYAAPEPLPPSAPTRAGDRLYLDGPTARRIPEPGIPYPGGPF